jgi:hypothetical protein
VKKLQFAKKKEKVLRNYSSIYEREKTDFLFSKMKENKNSSHSRNEIFRAKINEEKKITSRKFNKNSFLSSSRQLSINPSLQDAPRQQVK